MGTHANARNGDDARQVLDALRKIVRALRLFDRDAEKQVQLSGAQLFVLQKLRDTDASINELAERTFTHQSSVSVVVSKLEGRKLIHREIAEGDARKSILSLTARGRTLVENAPASAQDRLISALGQMSEEDRQQLSQLLGKLVQLTGIEQQPATLFFEDSANERSRPASTRNRSSSRRKGGSHE